MSLLRIEALPQVGVNPLQVTDIRWAKGYRLGDHPCHPRFKKDDLHTAWVAARVVVYLSNGQKMTVRCSSNKRAALLAGELQLQLDALLEEFRREGLS